MSKDITGKVFGRLTALKRIGRVGSHALWLFQCICGKIKKTKTGNVTTGRVRSCGCLRRETASKMGLTYGPRHGGNIQWVRTVPPGHDACRCLMQGYKSDAAKRGLKFELNFDQFLKLTSANCAYCGSPPFCVFTGRQKKMKSDYVYNGLDRIQANKGYTASNVRTCCKWCNRAKFTRSERDFKTWAAALSAWALK